MKIFVLLLSSLALFISGCISYDNVQRMVAIKEIESGTLVHGNELTFYHPHKIIPLNSPGMFQVEMIEHQWSEITLPTLTLYTHFDKHTFWIDVSEVRNGGRVEGKHRVLVIDREQNKRDLEERPALYELVILKVEPGAVGNEGHRGAD